MFFVLIKLIKLLLFPLDLVCILFKNKSDEDLIFIELSSI